MFRPLALLILALAAAAPLRAQPVRSEAPIRETVLSNGARRYAVPVRVGHTELLAALDTGSTGLRILPGVLRPTDVRPSEDAETYGYASGSRYEGVASAAPMAIGGLAGVAPVHLIRTIGCYDYLPHCPASRTTLDKYGIASDGLPDEGFKAILGIDMAPGKVSNPLMAMGARRWIVELPRPGEGVGRLIVNPTDDEVAGFAMTPLAAPYAHERGGGLHDAVPGCLVNRAARARACGVVLMDTGAPGLAVANGRLDDPPWPDGATAELELFDTVGDVAVEAPFVLGDRDLGTRLSYRRERRVFGTVIYAGTAPYFAYSVLYDPAHRRIGLKARLPAAVATTAR
ncbi:hypothetical protein [Phenylobacterium sp.]|uniref:hypothetical protein n=1 Tax=Phenylobacterium sp. TaxID=1871053 RepID=UPI001217D9C9|nr:hypothetical protein [Phenylobacterium sp.]THD64709.1 MAG: hypothetical protein E8A49_01290 [Phenylobacterium sp.]